MASIIVNQGLQRIGINASAVGTTPGSSLSTGRWFQCMSVDDNSSAFAAAHTNLLSAGSITNEFDALLDATPSRTNQTVSHVMTIPTGSGNFLIRRVALHDDTATNVTTTSTTLAAGIDGQSLTKTSDFTLAITVSITYTSI